MNGDRMMIHDLARRVSALEDRLSPPEDAPKPPTLRELVAKAWCADYYGEDSGSAKNPAPEQAAAADAVLAVVADWLAAQPLTEHAELCSHAHIERNHDVRLLRGES